jgi:hypothetical protein
MSLNIYGPPRDAEYVGRQLGEAEAFLQDPYCVREGIRYDNPQWLQEPKGHDNPQWLHNLGRNTDAQSIRSGGKEILQWSARDVADMDEAQRKKDDSQDSEDGEDKAEDDVEDSTEDDSGSSEVYRQASHLLFTTSSCIESPRDMFSVMIGPDEIRRTIQSDKLSKSPFLKVMVDGQLLESQTKVINLPEDNDEVVDVALRYLDTGAYDLNPQSIRQGSKHIIILHTQVAELADRWLLDDLQQISLGEIKCIWKSQSSNQTYRLTRLVYSRLRKHGYGVPQQLRNMCIDYYRERRVNYSWKLPDPTGDSTFDADIASSKRSYILQITLSSRMAREYVLLSNAKMTANT